MFEDINEIDKQYYSNEQWRRKEIRFNRYLFIHSGYFYSTSSRPLLLRGAPDTAQIVPEFHAEAPQATVSEGLAQDS